jgi:hypothetical protein
VVGGTASFAAGGQAVGSGVRGRSRVFGGGGAVRSSHPGLVPGVGVAAVGSRAPPGSPAAAATAEEVGAPEGRQVEGRRLEQSGERVPGRGCPAQRTPTCRRAPRGTGSHLPRSRWVPGSPLR